MSSMTREEAIVFAQASAWTWIYFAPRAAKLLIEANGPFTDMDTETSIATQTMFLRRCIYADGVDIESAHENVMTLLERDGLEPAPAPWMIDNYMKRGVLLPEDPWFPTT